MVFDSEGIIYGSNFSGDSVYKITPSGEISVFASGFQNPNGLAFDSQGNLFIVEYSGAKIHKYDSNATLIQNYTITDGFPSNIIKAYDSDAMIFTNVSDQSINELSEDGSITKLYTGEPLNIPVGLAYDNYGNLYIGNYLDREIYMLDGSQMKYIATVPDSGTIFPYLAFISFANDLLWATNYGEQKIYTVNPNNLDDVAIFSGSVLGNTDGNYTEATYTYPAGILYNAEEDAIYLNQYFDGSVREISDISTYERPSIHLKIAPNPVKSHFIIFGKLPEPGEYNISIYTMSGTLVYQSDETSFPHNTYRKRIHINEFSSTSSNNIYIVQITAERQQRSKLLLVRQ